MSVKWDKRFMELAEHVSGWSRDPSTKCGAVVTRGKFIVAVGFNGFPAGCDDSSDIYTDRPRKYKRILHAEQNAMLSAKQDLTGCTVYIYPLPPCAQCAAAMIQAGIAKVVTQSPSEELSLRWGDSLDESLLMFKESGVGYFEMIGDAHEGV